MKSICCCLLACLLSFGVVAQTDSTKRVPTAKVAVKQAPNDRATIKLRQPSNARLDDYRSRRDYDYTRDVAPPQSPIDRFWAWLSEKIGNFLKSKSFDSFWQYVILALVAALALWLAWKSEFLGNMFGNTPQNALDYEALTENIHELDFTDLIEKAVEQRNYRLAVRLYYLKTLKQLTDKNHIEWQPTKTNRSYLYELGQSPLYAGFEDITQQFEYVWYGDFPVSEVAFGQLKTRFQTFLAKV